MYDTARRVALVKQRVRENTRRRQRREAISLSAACMLLCAALTLPAKAARRRVPVQADKANNTARIANFFILQSFR